MIAPLIRSSPLFDRAVMWSGAFSDWIAARMTKQEALFSEIVRRLCAQTGPVASSPIACLEGAVVGALLDAATQAVEAVCSGHACLQPTIDGVELTDDPRSLFAVPGAVPGAVPMMLGSTIDEGDGFDAGGGLSHQSSAQQARGLPLITADYRTNRAPSRRADCLITADYRTNRAPSRRADCL